MILQRLFRSQKPRKHPIRRDSQGKSLRARCFEQFYEGKRPVEVATELGMKKSTSIRYFQDWKRLDPDFKKQYSFVKGLLKKTAPDRESTLEMLAGVFGISKEELETILIKPHGLRQLLTGKIVLPGQPNAEYKSKVSLKLALLISNHLVKNGGKFEDVRFAFERLMKKNQEYRNERDADIHEDNREIAFARQILEAADKAEQEGRVKRDKLTDEEINDLIRYGMEAKAESKVRDLEKSYWLRIAELMVGGLTREQARDKVYQDLMDKADLEGAKMMRQYQDKIHPMKSEDQNPPAKPLKPLSTE
ncbi:hypothetical protein ACFLWR_02925 [Chloroflexota bacterium]